MAANGVGLVLFLVATLAGCVLAEKVCPSEIANGFDWTYNGTNSFVTSDPLCLASNGLLITRNCSSGVWIPDQPQCAYNPRPHPAVTCPREWKQISSDTRLCAKFELTTAWANTCSHYGGEYNTIFDLSASDWSAFIDRFQPTYGHVWLPGKWSSADTISWKLPGKMMKSHAVNRTRIRQNHRGGSGCVLMSLENNQYYLSSVDCSEPHAMLCLSTEPAKMLQLACPPGYLADRRNGSWCHTVTHMDCTAYTAPAGHNLFEMWNVNALDVPMQLLQNRSGADSRCTFNPMPDNLTTFYQRSDFNKKFNYSLGFVNWRPTTDFSVATDYLVSDSSGQWSFAAEPTCAIWSLQIDLKLPALNLHYTKDYQQLLLNVTDPRFVWQESPDDPGVSCYRLDGMTEVRIDVERVSGIHDQPVVYQLPNLQPGVHKCEAYAIKSMERVESAPAMVGKDDSFVITAVVNVSRDEFHQFVNHYRTEHHKMVMDNVDILRFDALPGSNTNRSQYNATFRADVRNITFFEPNEVLRIQSKCEFIQKILLNVSNDGPTVVRSTRLCFDFSSTDDGMTVQWPALLVGDSVKAVVTCPDLSRHPILGACIPKGELSLATWHLDDTIKCQASVPALTDSLEQVVDDFEGNSATLPRAINRVLDILDDSHETFDSTQLFLINQIMNQTHNAGLDETAKDQSLEIFDKLFAHPPRRDFQSVNITRNVLDSFQSAVIHLSDKNSIEKTNYRIITLDPRANNYSGICLLRSGEVEFLPSNQSIDTIFGMSDLLMATFIPEQILIEMQRLTKIVFTIIKTDNLHQQPVHAFRLASYIIDIQIPHVDTTTLPGPIPLFFNNIPEDSSAATGRYWKSTDGWVLPKHFDDVGNKHIYDVQAENSIEQYNATNLASFALLMTEGTTLGHMHQRIIAWISVAGCCLSLFGIALIFLTALCVRKWLQIPSNAMLLQLSVSVGMMIMLFLLNVYGVSELSAVACISIGALLHYLVLNIFMWMVVMCYFQYFKYIVAFKKYRDSKSYSIVFWLCWTLPLVPVLVIALLSPDSYVRRINAGQQFCYASGNALWWGVVGPVALIGCVNIIIYAWILWIFSHVQKKDILTNIKVSVMLFFSLGLPWLFGLLIYWDITRTACYYLFSLSATLQGFVLGIYSIVLDRNVRYKWATVIGLKRQRHGRNRTTATRPNSSVWHNNILYLSQRFTKH